MNTDRDMHFTDFAKALFQEMQPDLATLCVALGSRRELDITSTEQIIQQFLARRAYDLAMHVIGSLEAYDYNMATKDADLLERVPDLSKLPKVEENGQND